MKDYWLDFVAFVFGLSVAWFADWQTGDLIWSLWLSSLSVGYLTMLLTLAAGGVLSYYIITHEEYPKRYRAHGILVATLLCGLLFWFFCFHFGAFHAGHASFLTTLYPIEGLTSKPFGSAFNDPLALWAIALEHIMPHYGIFIIPMAISERRHLARPLKNAFAVLRNRTLNSESFLRADTKPQFGDPFFRPYINVVRMHVLIFVLAIGSQLNIDNFALYALVYFVYFFPWSVFKKQESVEAV